MVAFNLDGTRRRWWTSMIEGIDDRTLRTRSRKGNPVAGPKGGWVSPANIHACYWFDRMYNLLELYDSAGALSQIYVHIASPARIVNRELHYTDYELDVVCYPGQAPVIHDEDEFESAVAEQGAPAEFRAVCHQAVEEVTELVKAWAARGLS